MNYSIFLSLNFFLRKAFNSMNLKEIQKKMSVLSFNETVLIVYTFLINFISAWALAAPVYDWQLSRRLLMIQFGLSLPFFILFRKQVKITKLETILFCSTAFYILSGLISYSIHGPYLLGLEMITENHILLIAIIPLAIVLKHIRIYRSFFFIALVALILSSSFDTVRLSLEGIYRPTPFLTGNSNIFVEMFVPYILVTLFISVYRKEFLVRFLGWVSIFCGVVTLYINQSRASWGIFGLGAVIILYGVIKSGKKKLVLTVALVLLIVVALQTSVVKERVAMIQSDIENFQSGNNNTSLGIRADLAGISIYYFKKFPIFGIGPRRLGDSAFTSQYLNRNDYTFPVEIHQSHFHNQYLEDLTTKGVVGAFSLLFLLGSFTIYFFLKRKIELYSSLGTIVTATFIVFGLSEVTFMQYLVTVVFVVMMPVLIALVEQSENSGLILENQFFPK